VAEQGPSPYYYRPRGQEQGKGANPNATASQPQGWHKLGRWRVASRLPTCDNMKSTNDTVRTHHMTDEQLIADYLARGGEVKKLRRRATNGMTHRDWHDALRADYIPIADRMRQRAERRGE
jgi:hypothetical protein